MTTRAALVAKAREYIGTPFHHMGRLPGVGLDCAGVVICAAREVGLLSPDFDVPDYQPSPDGTMLAWCREYMDEVDVAYMQLADVVVMRRGSEPQHLGLLGDYPLGGFSLIHAASTSLTRGRVVESRLMFSRALVFSAAFSLRGIS